jgi:hypothetical protein
MIDDLEEAALQSIEILSNDHSEVENSLSETKQLEDTIASFNALAGKNRIPGNLRIPEGDRPLLILEAEVQKSFADARRKLEAIMEKITAALEGKVSALRNKPS